MNSNKLWTRDFTIITIGSVISMLGNSMAGFAISLFVLDYTQTPFLYALYLFLYTLPQIAAPVMAGPLMDRFSRRKTIYLLDFLTAGIYCGAGLLIWKGLFNFAFLAVMTLGIGTIHSTYMVAFQSFYPMLIPAGKYSKAYSVSSTLETLTYVMLPVATFLYKEVGIGPLLILNSVFFFTAAIFETRISDVESLGKGAAYQCYTLRAYVEDSKEGFRYLAGEKGLLCVALYFTVSALVGGAESVITLPWFRNTFLNGEYVYMSVWVYMIVGRVAGGLINYRRRIPTEKKYRIAFFVYIISSVLEGGYLYTPLNMMRIACFLMGILNITSYNIRISATQAYVPDEKKGRFNGAFLMMNTVGSLAGQLLSGALITFLPMRAALAIFMGLCIVAAVVFIGGGKRYIKPIYNQMT